MGNADSTIYQFPMGWYVKSPYWERILIQYNSVATLKVGADRHRIMKPSSSSTQILHDQRHSLKQTLYTRLLCSSFFYHFIVLCVLIIVAIVLNIMIFSYQNLPHFPKLPIDYNTLEYQINNENSRILKVYDFSHYTSSSFLKDLYESPEIRQQFGIVRIQWNREEMVGLQQLNTHPYDLLVIKESWMQKTSLDVISKYQEIAAYPIYSGYLIAMQERPRLELSYLKGKRLGLIDNPMSMSGHLIPRRMLHAANIDEQVLKIRYYKTHEELRNALIGGEVDLIGSYWGEDDDKRLIINHRLKIQDGISGSKWYLNPDLIDKNIHCAIVRVLKKRADESNIEYFKKLEITRNCNYENQ